MDPCILLVDDFDDALEMYAEYLRFKGYRILTAHSGPEALSLATTEKPALILMDLRMPGMTGTETLRLLHANSETAAIPVIAFTAHALEEERRDALHDGFNDVIAKPCLPDDLAAAIDRLLRDHEGSN